MKVPVQEAQGVFDIFHAPSALVSGGLIISIGATMWKVLQSRTKSLIETLEKDLAHEREQNDKLMKQKDCLYTEIIQNIKDVEKKPVLNGSGRKMMTDVGKILSLLEKGK